MSALWHGHELDEQSLNSWTFELVEAALAVPPDRRDAFVAIACEGSDALRSRVEASLRFAVIDGDVASERGVCAPGDVIGNCLILRRIARGGAGEVYKAIQRPLRRLVAVKVLISLRDDERKAFEREAARVAQLKHRNIVEVYDADFFSRRPVVVMEYVPGQTLRQWLERRAETEHWHPDLPSIVAITRQICDALHVAHMRGIVHRDVKPENVLLTDDDGIQVKVADFGVARHVDAADIDMVGTPGYISPEQLEGRPPDARADIFSVGVLLYELLVGRHPFVGQNHAQTLANTLTRDVEFDGDPAVPARYRAAAAKALAKSPAARYSSVTELIADLEDRGSDSAEHGSENPFLSEFPVPLRRWMGRHSTGVPIAVASALWGCLSIALSIAAGAACTRVAWSASDGRMFEMIYGYVIEPNAGPWYVVGASITVIAGFVFLHAAYVGLARTPGMAAVDRSQPVSALSGISALNRRYFRVITPAIFIGAVPFVLVPEVAFRHSNAFGWVQADLPIEYVGVQERALVLAGKTAAMDSIHAQCPGCELRVARVHNATDGFHRPGPTVFRLFLASALTHEILFSAFLVFIAAKFVFFFTMLSRALLGDGRDGITLTPDLRDRQDARFGLGRLDAVYLATLAFLMVCAVGRLCQVIANLHKGTNFFRASAAVPLIGQLLVISAVVVLVFMVVAVPLGLFVLLTIRVIDRERARLIRVEQQLQSRAVQASFREARARIEAEIADVMERRRILDCQRLLPTERPLFWSLLTLTVIILIAAPPAFASRPGWEFVRQISEWLCAACGNVPPL